MIKYDLIYSIISKNQNDYIKIISNILHIDNKNKFIICILTNELNISKDLFINSKYKNIIILNFTDLENKNLFNLHIENFNKIRKMIKFDYYCIVNSNTYLTKCPIDYNIYNDNFKFFCKPKYSIRIKKNNIINFCKKNQINIDNDDFLNKIYKYDDIINIINFNIEKKLLLSNCGKKLYIKKKKKCAYFYLEYII